MRVVFLGALLSVVFGIGLSNFRVLILLPSLALAGLFILGAGVAGSERGFLIAQVLMFAVVGLQLGYFVGMACWPAVARLWTNTLNVRRRPPTSAPRRRYMADPF